MMQDTTGTGEYLAYFMPLVAVRVRDGAVVAVETDWNESYQYLYATDEDGHATEEMHLPGDSYDVVASRVACEYLDSSELQARIARVAGSDIAGMPRA